MRAVPDDLRKQLEDARQPHVLAGWEQLPDKERQTLLDQLRSIPLGEMSRLYAERDHAFTVPTAERIKPIPVVSLAELRATESRLAQRGEAALQAGEVAVLMVAGGQGSRLGFEHPKGMFPIGPVSNCTLFQIHCEKVLALSRRHGRPVPFLIMTSPATHEETVAFLKEHQFFGLPADEVFFFCQGTMPALDMATGRLLMEAPGRLFLSPNGHGGTLTALADTGLLERLRQRGIKQIFYFQVDNPLIKIADPVFLGLHLERHAEVSAKVVRKESPTDKLGNLVLVDGRCCMIEYSDLPDSLAKATDEQGQLRIWAGSPAIHLFSVEFLERVTSGTQRIPYHVARKKVPYLDEQGRQVKPEKENALKFEMFIFDVLPMADRWLIVETSRPEEFVPLKNATGADSPETVRAALSNLAAKWLEAAGVKVPRDADGAPRWPLEISPLLALDAAELANRVDRQRRIEGPTYLK